MVRVCLIWLCTCGFTVTVYFCQVQAGLPAGESERERAWKLNGKAAFFFQCERQPVLLLPCHSSLRVFVLTEKKA